MENDSKKQVLINLANRIKKTRKSKGLSQEDAYNDTGIHFARIEQGKRDVTFYTLYKICLYFDITFTEFFNDN